MRTYRKTDRLKSKSLKCDSQMIQRIRKKQIEENKRPTIERERGRYFQLVTGFALFQTILTPYRRRKHCSVFIIIVIITAHIIITFIPNVVLNIAKGSTHPGVKSSTFAKSKASTLCFFLKIQSIVKHQYIEILKTAVPLRLGVVD